MFCCGKHLKIEAETFADPVWCAVCGSNLDLEELPLSKKLMDDLWKWNLQFHNGVAENDHDDNDIIKNVDFEWVTQHNEWGLKLTEKVQKELGSGVLVSFSPIKLS